MSAGISVVVLSFSEAHLVERWIEQTQCPFPVFIDSERAIYARLGLKRSLKAVMSSEVMRYYGEKVASGEPLPDMGHEHEEDTLQLGGDFTVDKATRILFAYPSKSAKDRPTLAAILAGRN